MKSSPEQSKLQAAMRRAMMHHVATRRFAQCRDDDCNFISSAVRNDVAGVLNSARQHAEKTGHPVSVITTHFEEFCL